MIGKSRLIGNIDDIILPTGKVLCKHKSWSYGCCKEGMFLGGSETELKLFAVSGIDAGSAVSRLAEYDIELQWPANGWVSVWKSDDPSVYAKWEFDRRLNRIAEIQRQAEAFLAWSTFRRAATPVSFIPRREVNNPTFDMWGCFNDRLRHAQLEEDRANLLRLVNIPDAVEVNSYILFGPPLKAGRSVGCRGTVYDVCGKVTDVTANMIFLHGTKKYELECRDIKIVRHEQGVAP